MSNSNFGIFIKRIFKLKMEKIKEEYYRKHIVNKLINFIHQFMPAKK